MPGIENVKDICLTLVYVALKIEAATDEDSPKGKKFALLQEGLPIIVFLIPKAISYASDAAEIKDEFMDLTGEELDELKDYIAVELDLENDKIEALIEAGLDFLGAVYDMIQAVKDLKEDEG